jgi:hypothetical protein
MHGNHDWVIIGGSYPGALSAWFKHLYPSHVVAAWSSSGVIDAIEDFTAMDYDVFDATNKSSSLCPANIHYTSEQIDYIYLNGSPSERAEMFRKLGVTNTAIEHGDLMYMVADVFTSGVQSGQRTELCAFITSDEWVKDPVG